MTPPAAAWRRASRIAWRIAGLALVALVLYFVGARVAGVWDEIRRQAFQVRLAPLVLAWVVLLGAFAWFSVAWRLVLGRLGYARPLRELAPIWYRAQLAKYMPGFIWHVAGRAAGGQRLGIPWPVTILSTALESVLLVVAALLFTAVTAALSGQALPVPGGGWTILGLLALVPLLFHHRVLDLVLRRLGGEAAPRLPLPTLLPLLGAYLLVWVLAGAGFVLLMSAFHPVPVVDWPLLGGIFSLSWAIGFLAVFAPGGIGFREGAMLWMLDTRVPAEVAAVVVLAARLWWIAAELGMAGLVTLIPGRQRTTVHGAHSLREAPAEAAGNPDDAG